MLYPIKALKKYKIADMKLFEPVVSLSNVEGNCMDSSSVVYVGNHGEQPAAPPQPISTLEFALVFWFTCRTQAKPVEMSNTGETSETNKTIETLQMENRMKTQFY